MSNPAMWSAFFSGGSEYFSWRIWPVVVGWLLLAALAWFRKPEENNRADSRAQVGHPDLWFTLGFGFGFVVLALPATDAGQWLWMMGPQVRRVGGILAVVLGWYHLSGWKGRQGGGARFYETFPPLMMGLGMAAAWSPAVGPKMVSWILEAASAGGKVVGILSLTAYALGLCVPLIALGVFGSALAARGAGPGTNHGTRAAGIPAVGLMAWGLVLFFDRF